MPRQNPVRVLLATISIIATTAISLHPYICKAADKHAISSKSNKSLNTGKKPGVRELFSEGESLFKNKKYKQATSIFAKTLSYYPDHEPTLLLYARAAYALGHTKDAYTLFSRLRLDELDPEVSYEYAYSFYNQKNWQGALLAFKRIPNKHSLSDLANYYGGVCALRLKKYNLAESMMEQAVVLPEKQAKTRDLYIKHLEEIRLIRQKKNLDKQKDKIKQQMNANNKTFPIKPEQKTRQSPVAEKKTEKNKSNTEQDQGIMSITHSAEVETLTKNQLIDMNGLVSKTSNLSIGSFTFKTGAMAKFPIPNGLDGMIGTQISASIEDEKSKGKESRILNFENKNSLEKVTAKDEDYHITYSRVGAEPWIEVPFLDGYWLALVGSIEFKYPDVVDRSKRTGSRGGAIKATKSINEFKLNLNFNYDDILNNKTVPITNKVAVTVDATASPLKDFSVNIKTGYSSYQYLDINLEGPDAVTSVQAELSQEFPLGISISLLGAISAISDQRSYASQNYDFMSANGVEKLATLSASASPFSWISFNASLTYSSTAWADISPDNAEDEWELNIPNYLEEQVYSVKILKTF
ncbi:MAG: tetratricopeptide repeat protein [Bdellovibrionota bacterium]